MPDIVLHIYNPEEKSSALNAPHRIRLKKWENFKKDILKEWHSSKEKKVLHPFGTEISRLTWKNEKIIIAAAPSTVTTFVNELRNRTLANLPNAIDATNCFSKDQTFSAGKEKTTLDDDALRRKYSLNEDCFKGLCVGETASFLLIDDVFAYGNTLRAMEILIKDIYPEAEIKTAIMLQT